MITDRDISVAVTTIDSDLMEAEMLIKLIDLKSKFTFANSKKEKK